MLKHLYYLIAIILFSSCERTIDLKVNNQPAKLVVDAKHRKQWTPLVVLSTSLNYFSTITPEELSASFVHNAIVTVSDGTKTVQLNEISYTDSSGY